MSSASAIFFDWNGTLLADSLHCWRATNVALKMFNVPEVSLSHYRHQWALPIANLYKGLGCDAKELFEREQELYTTWNAVYKPWADKARLRRGARSVLHTLREKNHDVLILSNHTVENITEHTRRLGVHHHLTTILANDKHRDNFKNTNKSMRLKSYLQDHAIKNALIVGDTEEEIDLARSHGIISVAITDGQCSTKRLRAAKPDYLIRSLTEVPKIAEEVLKMTGGEK